jgi:hypothetical protein
MTPPIRRAIEKCGVFKKPIAKATPEGIQVANQCWRRTVRVFIAERNPKNIEKLSMNDALFSGNWPSPK